MPRDLRALCRARFVFRIKVRGAVFHSCVHAQFASAFFRTGPALLACGASEWNGTTCAVLVLSQTVSSLNETQPKPLSLSLSFTLTILW